MGKILVISYSLNGTTLDVAETIAAQLGADTSEIEDATPREGLLRNLRAGFEAVAKGLPSILVDRNPAHYDFVILGTPVWAGSMSSPMRTFLFTHAEKIRNVACFCTTGGRGAEATLREMKALLGVVAAPTMSLSEHDLRDGRRESKIDEFVAIVRARAQATPVAAVS